MSDWPLKGEFELDYKESTTASITISASTEATADTVITADATTFDGVTPVIIETYIPSYWSGAILGDLYFVLYEDGSSIGRFTETFQNNSQQDGMPLILSRRMTPTAGSHTYSIRAYRPSAPNTNASVHGGSGGSGNLFPTYIRITTVAVK